MKQQAKYVDLEPGAWLSDPEFQIMSAEERGVYWSLVLNLYCNRGRLKYDLDRLRKLCNCSVDFQFQSVFVKFKIQRGFIRHKRVTRELAKVQARMTQAVKAAQERWREHSDSNAGASPEQCQMNTNINTKLKNNNIPPITPLKKSHPSQEEFVKYVQDNQLNIRNPEGLWQGYEDGGWIDTSGKAVKNWKLKCRTLHNFAERKQQNGRTPEIRGDTERTERYR